jgi:hypothetical protein
MPPQRPFGAGRGNAFLQDQLRERNGTAAGDTAVSGPTGDTAVSGPTGDTAVTTGAGDTAVNGPVGDTAVTPGTGSAAGPVAEGPGCTPTGPTGDYVTMGGNDKAGYLAELFRTPGVAKTFQDRGFNNTDQSQLAAVMQNEGGLNERRRMLGSHYTLAAHVLVRKLTAVGRSATQLDGAEADPKLKLTEDEKAVLTAAQGGQFDLAAIDSKDTKTQEAARGGLLQAGIDHQSALFDEYSGLVGRQKGGEKLSKDEQARMSSLRGHTLYSSGTFGDARGMSSARFKGVYDEGQTRFEPSRFARSRDHIERWEAGGEKGDGGSVGAGNESSKDWVARHPEAKNGDMDALADAETSWGTAQIMGHYADRGDLHKADGTSFGMGDMRAAAGRRSPDGTDVDMQISYFRDVAGVQGHLGSAQDIAVQYNGPDAPPSYADGLTSNAARYNRARSGLAPEDCVPGRQSLLDDPERGLVS